MEPALNGLYLLQLVEVYRRGAETVPVKREAYLGKIAGLARPSK